LEGFFFQLDAHAVLAKFTRFERHFERAESHNRKQILQFIHGLCPGDFLASTPGCPPILSFSLEFLV